MPLAQTITSATIPEGHKQSRGSATKKKLVAGGKLYRRATNRKNEEPYFNLVKKDIIDSSDHTIPLDNDHNLRKSDLAIKGKLLPGPNKIVVNQPSIGHKSNFHSSLAGKRKLSPPKKTSPQPRQGTSGAGGSTQRSDSQTDVEATKDLIQISSGSSSSLKLNSWDGIIDDYFDDVTNNNLPPSHQSQSNQGLSVTGDAHSPQLRPNLLVNTDQRAIKEIPESAEIECSESNPITLGSAPETVVLSNPQPRHAGPHRNVGPPKFFGDRRFIDVVLEKDDQPTFPSQMDIANQPRATFVITSPSNMLTPLAKAPPVRTLVAETTLTWSSKKSCPSDRPNYTPIM